MQSLKATTVIIFLITLFACASAPPIQQPIQIDTTGSYEIFRSPILDQTNHTLQHLNQNKDIVYFQTYGGGGVGVGVLLGPLGVAANIKMIESNTMKDVATLKDKIGINPNESFLKAASKSGINIASGKANGGIRFSPYLLVEKTEGDVIMLASVILAEKVGSNEKWPSKYVVQLPITYNVAALAKLDEEQNAHLNKLAENGFISLLSRIKAESTANPATEEKIKVTSEFMSPRFKFEMAGNLIEKNDEYTWVRMIGGIYGVRNSDITVKPVNARKK